MKTIEERARLAAQQIFEEIGLSQHSVERVAEIIAEKMNEQKAIDEAKLLKLKSAWEKQAQINHDDEANYQQGYHDAIEKACEWLGPHLAEVADLYDSTAGLLLRLVKENFRIAMEKEL